MCKKKMKNEPPPTPLPTKKKKNRKVYGNSESLEPRHGDYKSRQLSTDLPYCIIDI